MDVYGALADPVRRSLLAELATAPTRVADLAAQRPISRPAVSKHLRLLSEAGLVEGVDHGRERHYALRAEGLAPVQAFVAGLVARDDSRVGSAGPDLASALDALETEVRRTERERRSQSAVDVSTQTREESA